MADEIVVLHEYASEAEAELVAAELEANGIAAQVVRNSMAYPPRLAVPVLVRAEDAELARQLLEYPAE